MPRPLGLVVWKASKIRSALIGRRIGTGQLFWGHYAKRRVVESVKRACRTNQSEWFAVLSVANDLSRFADPLLFRNAPLRFLGPTLPGLSPRCYSDRFEIVRDQILTARRSFSRTIDRSLIETAEAHALSLCPRQGCCPAALRINRVISSGCEISERWLAFTSMVWAPIRLAMKRSRSGLMVRSSVETA